MAFPTHTQFHRCPQCSRPIFPGSLVVEARIHQPPNAVIALSDLGTVFAHHTCPANFGVQRIDDEEELPINLDHEDIGRRYRLGYVTYEWIGRMWFKYREDGLPT